MLRQQFKNGPKAQILLEYTIVLGAIVLIMVAMGTLIKRGTQGMVKVVADQLGNQEEADQRFDEEGHLASSYAVTRSRLDKTKREFFRNIEYVHGDVIKTDGETSINLGFTESN